MNTKLYLSLIILSLVISSISCGITVDLGPTFQSPTPLPPTESAAPIPEATEVTTGLTVYPTETLTSLPETPTTALPIEPTMEELAEPVAKPTAIPLQLPEVISVQNAKDLTLKRIPGINAGSLQKLRVSPDGKLLLFSYSNLLALFDAGDLSVLWEVDPGRFLSDVVFSKDGNHLIAYSPGGSVTVYDVATGAALAVTIPQREGVRSMALSAHGEYYAVLDYSDETRVYEAETGKEVMRNNGQSNPGGLNSIHLSPGGGTLLIDGFDSKPRKQVQQWNVTDGSYKIGLLGLITEMTNWKFSPDAKRIFGINTRSLTSTPANTLNAWNTSNGALVKTYENLGIITDFVISPDGAILLVATNDNLIHLLDVESGQRKGTFTGHSNPIAGMDFSPDGQGVISAGVDGVVYLWDVVDQKSVFNLNYVNSFPKGITAFSSDGRFAAIIIPDRKKEVVVELVNRVGAVTLGPETNNLRAPAISQDGRFTAAVDSTNQIKVWETSNGKKLQNIDAKTRTPIEKILFSPDGKTIASLNTGQVFLWDVTTGKKMKEFVGNKDFAWSPDGRTIASDSSDNRLNLTDVDSGKKIAAINAEAISSINYSRDGSLISVGGTGIQMKYRGLVNLIFQLDTGSKLRLPVEMPEILGTVTSTAYSPKIDLLAGCDSQGNIYLWNLLDGTQVAFFEEIAAFPGSVAFNSDGSELFIGSGDGSIGVISTVNSNKTAPEVQSAGATGSDQLPVLSAQPYVHTKGAVSLNLPVGWNLEEKEQTTIYSSDPAGRGNIIFSAVNTIEPLTDEGFLNFIDSQEMDLSEKAVGYREIDRSIDPSRGFGTVVKIVSIEGIDYQFETAYTRNDAVVYQVNFLTQVPYVELFLPLYQGVYASLQVDTAFIKTQIPYDDLNTQNGPDGKFSFVAPTGWKKAFLSITNETDLLYAAPDGRAGMQVISAAWNANDLTGDTEIFGAVQTELELREGYAIIVTREKKYDGWLITYAIPERDLVGMILGKRVGNTLQMVNVEYETSQTDLYRPLAEKILQGFVVK